MLMRWVIFSERTYKHELLHFASFGCALPRSARRVAVYRVYYHRYSLGVHLASYPSVGAFVE